MGVCVYIYMTKYHIVYIKYVHFVVCQLWLKNYRKKKKEKKERKEGRKKGRKEKNFLKGNKVRIRLGMKTIKDQIAGSM